MYRILNVFIQNFVFPMKKGSLSLIIILSLSSFTIYLFFSFHLKRCEMLRQEYKIPDANANFDHDVIKVKRKGLQTAGRVTAISDADDNNTTGNFGVILYNRVPKCGSSSMTEMIKQLSATLDYQMLDIKSKKLLPAVGEDLQKEIVTLMQAVPKGTFLIRHLYFLDFDRFESEWPIYINVMRDPIERYVSYYYFLRYGFQRLKKGPMPEDNPTRNESLDDCLDKKGFSCIKFAAPTILAFFCGQDEECRDYSSTYPLEKARENVEKHYLTVGLAEDFNNTLKVFQALLPSHFSGWEKISLTQVSAETKTYKRPPLKPYSIQLLKQYLQYEIEFYNYIKKRFYEQLEALHRDGRIQ